MVRCRIAMPEVVSSNPGRDKKIKFTKVVGSYGNCKFTYVQFVLC